MLWPRGILTEGAFVISGFLLYDVMGLDKIVYKMIGKPARLRMNEYLFVNGIFVDVTKMRNM